MSKGFAHPYLLIVVLAVAGVIFTVLTSSSKLAGLVLGSKTYNLATYRDKTEGLKVVVISPNSSWDLVQYLCRTREECEKSQTSGRWWVTVSGAPTTEDGHEIFIEKSPGWEGYGFLKVVVRQNEGSLQYLATKGGGFYEVIDIQNIQKNNSYAPSVEFR